MDGLSSEFVSAEASSGHAVHVHRDAAELAAGVGEYLAAGLDAAEPCVVVATAANRRGFAEELSARGWSPARIAAEATLVEADAESTLEAVTADGRIARGRFLELAGALLDRAAARAPGRRVRVYGEVVDVLCKRGDRDGALEIEALWDELGAGERFKLLCGYQLDVFDPEVQRTLLPHVCAEHTEVRVAHDHARLVHAVDAALEEALGPVQAGRIYVLAAKTTTPQVPLSELVLSWVSAHMPAHAGRILASARARYLAAPAA